MQRSKEMAKRRGKSKLSAGALIFIIAAVVIVKLFTGGYYDSAPLTNNNQNAVLTDGVSVHIIDVGQGSSALIQSGKHGILIDAGEKEYGQTVVSYLNKVGIQELDYVVASHPHSDHIGGLLNVLDAFKVDNIIMSELTESNTPTTRIYERLLDKIFDKNIKAIAAKYGSTYSIDGATLTVLGPVEQSRDLNNMSVICSVKAMTATFLFPGDAEVEELTSVYSFGADFKCDIMIMGHHGSNTSLYEPYLKKAAPSVAVISCGKNNSYGHPHKETIDYLNKNKIEYYRTDLVGDVVFTCGKDGYVVS